MNWKIEKISETSSKKLEFYIDNPETGLKKTDFNIITNNYQIDDMNDDNRYHSKNDLLNNMYSHIDHDNVDQKQKNHHNIYTFANDKLQLSSDLEDLDWNSTDSHKSELIIAYDNKVWNKTLCPRTFFVLYVKPNQEGNSHLIYRLDKDLLIWGFVIY